MQNNFEIKQQLLSVSETAKVLNVSTGTLRAWILARKNLPFCKVGRRVLFKIEDIETFIQQNTQKTF